MLLVDTNILLNAINSESPDHAGCVTAVENLVNGSEDWMLTWPVVYEFVRVATHPRVFEQPLTFDTATAYLNAWVSSDRCTVIGETAEHFQVLTELSEQTGRLAGNLLHDYHIAVLMFEHGIKEILTLDSDFRTFGWITIRDLPE